MDPGEPDRGGFAVPPGSTRQARSIGRDYRERRGVLQHGAIVVGVHLGVGGEGRPLQAGRVRGLPVELGEVEIGAATPGKVGSEARAPSIEGCAGGDLLLGVDDPHASQGLPSLRQSCSETGIRIVGAVQGDERARPQGACA